MAVMTLTPGATTLEQLNEFYRTQGAVKLNRAAQTAVEAAAAQIDIAVKGGDAVYGVNTGFGKLASVKIAAEDTAWNRA